MAVMIPNEGQIRALNDIKASTLLCKLFTNNLTFGVGTVIGDLTEATFSGYAAVTLSFGTVATNGSGQAEMVSATATFTRAVGATSNSVYGWYLVDSFNTKLVALDNVTSAPKSMTTVGDTITITFTVRLVRQ